MRTLVIPVALLFLSYKASAREVVYSHSLARGSMLPKALSVELETSYDLGKVKDKSTSGETTRHLLKQGTEKGASFSVTSRFSLIAEGWAEYAYHRNTVGEEGVLKSTLHSTAAQLHSFAVFSLTPEFDLLGGASATWTSGTTERFQLNDLEIEKRNEGTFLTSPRLGIIRRTSKWSAGAFYSLGNSKRLSSRRVVLNTEEEWPDVVFLPAKATLAISFALPNQWKSSVEISSLFAGSAPLPSATSSAIFRDFFEINVDFLTPALLGNFSFEGRLQHRTPAYESQADMNLENTPFTELSVRALSPWLGNQLMLTSTLGYGKDSQSLPSLNAEYQRFLFSLSFGIRFPTS